MKRLESWSPNLQSIILEILKNQRLCKLIYYNNENPLDQPDIHKTSTLVMTHILPYPFDLEITDTECVQIRVSYPELTIKNRFFEDTGVLFEVALSKNLWNITIDDEASLRPFEILSEIIEQFSDKSIEKVGRLDFKGARFVRYNSKFNGYELNAKMLSIGTGK
ncbi:hypothetical protein EEL31_09320 [Brevibacillus laterosporus]|nr:hypothetical protein [Brevibacillus laterosporus]TPG68704.1 hypothetical protein EEL31_09320 [Brevibacillus laterosporus]